MHQRIGEITPIDDEGLARAVAIALVGGHARQDVDEAVVVEVTCSHREAILVLRQTTCDDQTVVTQVVDAHHRVPVGAVFAVHHEQGTTVCVGGVAGGVVAHNRVLTACSEDQVVVAIVVQVTELGGTNQLVDGRAVERHHTACNFKLIEGCQIRPLPGLTEHQIEQAFGHMVCPHQVGVIGNGGVINVVG